jgi:hypothetical protein
VMSPSSLEAWKIDGFSNTNVAWPEVPVRARRSDTSGTVDSFTPLMNCREAASQTCNACWRRLVCSCGRGAAKPAAARWKGRTPEGGALCGAMRRQSGHCVWVVQMPCGCAPRLVAACSRHCTRPRTHAAAASHTCPQPRVDAAAWAVLCVVRSRVQQRTHTNHHY